MTIVPAAHGWQWITRGLALVGRAPLGWLVVSMSYWLVMGMISRLPYLGLLVASLATPALAVSFMAICRGLERGRERSSSRSSPKGSSGTWLRW